jgi:hypothetical protein
MREIQKVIQPLTDGPTLTNMHRQMGNHRRRQLLRCNPDRRLPERQSRFAADGRVWTTAYQRSGCHSVLVSQHMDHQTLTRLRLCSCTRTILLGMGSRFGGFFFRLSLRDQDEVIYE